jgi:hypothetical protein
MRSLSTLAVALFLASTASAADYYVDASSGNDANPGTAAQPWRTITFALGQPLASGDVLRLRGTFAASAESFPLSLLPGVSLTTWDSSSTARIDAGTAPCIRIIRPGDHTEEIVGNSGSLVIVGAPAVRIEAPTAATRCTSRIAGCRIEGRFEVYVAYGHPGYAGDFFHPVMEDCEVIGDMHLFSDSEGNYQYDNYFAFTARRNIIHGVLHAENLEVAQQGTCLILEDNDLARGLSVVETRGDSSGILISRNRVRSGSLAVDSYQSIIGLMFGEVRNNQVDSGAIAVRVKDDAHAIVTGNRCAGDLTAYMYYLRDCSDNRSGGTIRISGGVDIHPARICRNHAVELQASAFGGGMLLVEDNITNGGQIRLNGLGVISSIARNSVHDSPGEGLVILGAHFPGLMNLSIVANVISSRTTASGTGIVIDASSYVCEIQDNFVHGHQSGITLSQRSAFGNPHGPPGAVALSLERNSISRCDYGALMSLDNTTGDVAIRSNSVSSTLACLSIDRNQFSGSLSIIGNILYATSSTEFAPGSLSVSDRAEFNLSESGDLLPFHPSNIWGDPHFIDHENGDLRLRSTSPCGGMGAVQNGQQATLYLLELGGNRVSIRTLGASGDLAVLLVGAFPARPATVPACDGLLGLDTSGIITALTGMITLDRWDVIIDVPSNLSFTAVLQAGRFAQGTQWECSMTNTRFFRR